jgi:hypothetical protein
MTRVLAFCATRVGEFIERFGRGSEAALRRFDSSKDWPGALKDVEAVVVGVLLRNGG